MVLFEDTILVLYVYITGSVIFTVYGQLILKWRIGDYGQLPEGFFEKVLFLLNALLDPFIFSGLVAAFVAALFWMAAMTRADLSFAYPLIIAGLTLLTVILAVIMLGEPMSWLKAAGIGLVLVGVIILAYASIE